jgi:hypothetical protein
MPLSEPKPVSDVLASAVKALADHVATPEAAARREVELEARRRFAATSAVRRNIESRRIPSHRETRAAVLSESVALTAPLRSMLRALKWRHDRKLPTGEMPGLLVALKGPHGCGKTVACAWCVARWPRDAVIVTARELGEVPDTDWSDYVTLRGRWMTADLLVIDDVGADAMQARRRRAAERFASLVLARYDAGGATVASTNVSEQEFCDTYLATAEDVRLRDGRVVRGNGWLASRLSHEQRGGGCEYWYEFDSAPDYRQERSRITLSGLKRFDGKSMAAFSR